MALVKDPAVDYDVIGASYYPFYESTYSIDTVVNEFNTFVNTYDKDVIIMETGYNWNPSKKGGGDGQLHDSGYYQSIYGEDKAGQRAFLTELYAKLKTVLGGRCIGDLYWDPVMIKADSTVGWAQKELNGAADQEVVSNSTIFDFNGIAVPGQLAMKYNTESSDTLNISGKIKSGETVAANKEVTFIVNGEEYTRTTDKYGDYIVSIPYPEDGKVSVALKGSKTAYAKDAPTYEGILISGCDFNDYDETAVEDIILITSADETGKMSYETYFAKSDENDELWVALYSGGKLVEVKQTESGEFDKTAQSGETYTVKAMLWKEGGAPVYADSADNLTLVVE